jgi:hypothetical protein
MASLDAAKCGRFVSNAAEKIYNGTHWNEWRIGGTPCVVDVVQPIAEISFLTEVERFTT